MAVNSADLSALAGMTAVPRELIEPFARMAGVLVSEQTLASILELVVSLAAETVPAVHGASISITRNGRFSTAAWSDDEVREADGDQYELKHGPCVCAIESGETVYVESLCDDARWPDFGARTSDRGLASVLSLPLKSGDRAIGALNLYAETPSAFGPRDQELSAQFARQAATVLANADAYITSVERAEQLQEALATRDVIGQAKGILIGTQGCGPDEAFDILRRASQRENRKLRDVAQNIVDRAQQKNARAVSDILADRR